MDNESADILKGMQGERGFSVPENYFEQLNRDIQTRVAEERLKAISLNNGFTVPELYFEQLNSKILQKLTATPTVETAKVVRLWQKDLFKYATAACFILVTAVGLYFNNNAPKTQDPSIDLASEQFFQDIDEQQILEHIQEGQVLQTQTTASEQELEDYILTNYSSNDIALNL
ncbi:hypothetical protein [Pedobacter sp.]|uniref:hypothetical protein n=1 Tax=Pedobacter sp. TaxID=1411316 RepID=UPI003D7F5592